MKHRPKKVVSALALGAAAVWIVTGCISSPTAPTESPTSQTRNAGAAHDGGSGGGSDDGGSQSGSQTSGSTTSGTGTDDMRPRGETFTPSSDGSRTLLGSILDPLVKLVFRVVQIPLGQSGSITNGRWRLDVPAGAIAGSATVGIGVQTPTAFSCRLDILPMTLNHFATPVTVTANCRDIDKDKLKDWTIWWFDPAQNQWVRIPSNVDLTNGTVSAQLPHCSYYAAGPSGGKAGW